MKNHTENSMTKVVNLNQDWILYSRDKDGKEQKRKVMIPHDAMIEEKRSPENPSKSPGAYFPGGKYRYEKKVFIPKEWDEKVIHFEFEGVYRNAKVYLNDQYAGGCAYGYSPFRIAAGEMLNYGEENNICVEVDNEEQPNSRWYTGSGIYRPVWMWVQNQHHILPEGVKITTLSVDPAVIRVETQHTGGYVSVEVLDGDNVVAFEEGECVKLEIADAKLWSAEAPNLYKCRVSLYTEENGKKEKQDEVIESFGIRTIEWSNQGLFINGEETLLRGGCVHHDHGILGARAIEKAERRKVRLLKEAGYNAIRSSHNPTSKAFLKACDEYGMYLIDETWDMWYIHKHKMDYAVHFMENYKADIDAMIKRDYNHPSVIFYSIGNEVSEPAEAKGIELEKEMVSYIHTLDSTRAVTCGFNLGIVVAAAKGGGIREMFKNKEKGKTENEKNQSSEFGANSSEQFNEMASQIGTRMNQGANSEEADRITSHGLDLLDIAGYNYASGRYPLEAEAHPERVIYGSETFPQDIAKNWKMVKELPYLVGDFMWTAWDYLGETGIGAWAYTDDGKQFGKPYPWILAEAGALDILGNENAEAGYARTVWGLEKAPYIGVRPVNHPGIVPTMSVWRGTNALPSWSWSSCDGNEAVVEVYADAAKAELYRNGELVGRCKLEDMKAVFTTAYEPGELKAIVYDASDQAIASAILQSATGKVKIAAEPEETEVRQGEVVFVPIVLKGENGVVDCNSDQNLSINVENGELLAFGSANPRTEESYNTGNFTTYYGRALAVVYCPQSGIVRVNVNSEQQAQAVSAEIVVK